MIKNTIVNKEKVDDKDILHSQSELQNELEHRIAKNILNEGKQPSKILCFLTQRLENYRQSKKMGWSRTWNKKQIVNFQSFKLCNTDIELRKLALQVIAAEWPEMPTQANQFAQDLLSGDLAPMGFIFFHELNEEGKIYEGAILSYGRKSGENRRFRDRLDIILESPVIDGNSQGFSRLRIYVDPYLEHKAPLWSDVKETTFQPITEQLFRDLSALSWDWAKDKSRIWEHWVTQYIDFFGPRKTKMKSSYFHTAIPECRIDNAMTNKKAA